MADDIWIASAGLVTSLGDDVASTWSRLIAGQCGVGAIERFCADGLPTRVAATVNWKGQDNGAALANAMALRAVDEAMARCPLPETLRERAGVFVGCAAPESDWRRLLAHERAGGGLDRAVHHEQETIATLGAAIATRFGSRALPVHLNTACASAATAIAAAAEALHDGDHDVALVVGSDASVYEESIAKFCLLSAMTTANEAPERACKPFSADRDGFVMGEGAGAMILVAGRAAHALRGDPWARLAGVGAATDNFHRTRSSPDARAIVASMNAALVDAGLTPKDIAHINAHGTGTPENDKMESLGVRLLFGDRARLMPITANKAAVGHTLTAAGIVEGVLALLSLRARIIPPTLNHRIPDTDLGVLVADRALALEGAHVLSNSFGFGGQNVSLVFSGV